MCCLTVEHALFSMCCLIVEHVNVLWAVDALNVPRVYAVLDV